jgi:hypothetical protein
MLNLFFQGLNLVFVGLSVYKIGFMDKRMKMNECIYCKNTFSTKTALVRHVKSSVKCIKTRSGTTDVDELTCECGYTTFRSDHLLQHIAICKVLDGIKKYTKTIEDQANIIEDQANIIEDHVKTITNDSKTIAELKEQVKLLMTRPINVNNHNHNHTTTNNNGPTYNMSYYKQHIQDNFESITQPLLQGVMSQITLFDISYGGVGLAKFVKKHLDHQHLLMLDQARRKGAYKDAKGQVVVDAKLRTLLQMIGEAAYPPAKKIFIDWNAANPDGFLNSSKSKTLTSLIGATGWLNRVGEGKTDDDDSDILSSFIDELASGYTKEALHNHLDQQAEPPDIETPSGYESDVSSEWPEIYDEPESDIGEDYIETASMTSSQFEVVIGTKNYEACQARGILDEDNLYENFKPNSKYAITN